MSKVFDLDARYGSLYDRVNNILVINNGCAFKRMEKGLSVLLNNTSDITSYGSIHGVKTIVMFINPMNNTDILKDNGTDKLQISGGSYTGTGLTNTYINNVDTDTYLQNKWQIVVSEFSGGIDFSTDLEIDASNDIYIAKIAMYDTILTSDERDELYAEFQKSEIIAPPKRGFVYPKPTDLSGETDLVAAWNMMPKNQQVADISGNGNTGTIGAGVISRDNGLYLKGDSRADGKVINFGNPTDLTFSDDATTDYPFSLKVRIIDLGEKNVYVILSKWIAGDTENREWILSYINNKFLFYLNSYNNISIAISTVNTYSDNIFDVVCTYDGNGINGMNIYVNGVKDSIIFLNKTPYYYMNRSSCDVIIGDGYEGVFYPSSFIIYDAYIYNRELSESEIQEQYNEYANEVYLYENFEGNGADGLDVLPKGWSNQGRTGSWAIKELPTREKYMECLGTGNINIPSKQAYGTWEFDVYTNTNNQNNDYKILNDLNNYYSFRLKSDGTYSLTVNGADIITGTVLTSDAWCNVKITRDYNGLFTLYLNGTQIGTYTHTTYTDCNYFSCNLTSNYAVKNIVMKKGVEV